MSIEQSVSSYHEARTRQNELQKQIAALKSFAAQAVPDEKLSEMLNKSIEISEKIWKSNNDRLEFIEKLITDIVKLSTKGSC